MKRLGASRRPSSDEGAAHKKFSSSFQKLKGSDGLPFGLCRPLGATGGIEERSGQVLSSRFSFVFKGDAR